VPARFIVSFTFEQHHAFPSSHGRGFFYLLGSTGETPLNEIARRAIELEKGLSGSDMKLTENSEKLDNIFNN
jgi:hypothetical protein